MSVAHVYQPTTLESLAALVAAHPEAPLVGGGTLIIPTWQEQDAPSVAVYLPTVAALREHGDSWCGAGMTLNEIARTMHFPVGLREAAASIGGAALRNLATIGGNLASDGPRCLAVALLALDAVVERLEHTPAVITTQRSIAEVLTNPGAPIITIRWSMRSNSKSLFRKIAIRQPGGPNLASVAVRWDGPSQQRSAIAVGSVGTRPQRLFEAEEQWARLADLPHAAAAAAGRSAAAAVDVAADAATNDLAYRRHLVGVLVERALRTLTLSEGKNV